MKDIKDVIEKAQDCIKQTQNMGLNGHDLCELEAKLAGYYAYLIVKAGSSDHTLNTKYWQRKVSYSRQAIKARKAGGTIAESDHQALLDIADEIQQENDAVYWKEYLNKFCRGIEKVLVSLAHRIKFLENEAKRK